jgi:signal transduction histidine kinase
VEASGLEKAASGVEIADEERRELVDFAAAASHDLSTPLRLIAGYAELLAERVDESDPDVAAAMGGIRNGVERMQSLVDGLLSYARTADVGAVEPVDSREVVSQTLAALEPDLSAAGAEVSLGELPVVLGTPGQLHQLFQNLISNAVKFRSSEPPRIEIACEREPGVWHFTVADNGIGIAQRDVVRIFDLFGRSRAARERAGTGIGLAVAKEVVERLGGGIWVESEPERGSTFHFTLPVELRRSEDPRVARGDAAPPRGSS